jgi:DNA (cytosine-5)-methyltransferase 1
MAVYYNEIDPFAAAWLRNLIAAGHIPAGDVDERSIADVQPMELEKYTQCHFFAGIGGWSHALRLAEWPDDRPIWTGSCPCQPFSVAGKGKGKDDERHLWPVFFNLIRECRPSVVMGEQVAGAAGYGWFDGVQSDLAGEDYASRAVDIPACAIDAPHIRQRLYWVATDLANADMRQPEQHARDGRRPGQAPVPRTHAELAGRSELVSGDMADANERHLRGHARDARSETGASGGEAWPPDGNAACGSRGSRGTGDNHPASFWPDAIWLTGADGKARRAQPGIRLLVDGVPNRVGRLRGFGNAIVPPLAAEVIRAFMDV